MATQTLLMLLTREIARDGGGCFVTSLKDYIRITSRRLNALLVQSNIGKAKLLTFLESHPTVFRVDRGTIPHWVQLVTPPQLLPSINLDGHDEDNDGRNSTNVHCRESQHNPIINISDSSISNGGTSTVVRIDHHRDVGKLETLQDAVYDKAMYVLQKRRARLDRRWRTSTMKDGDNHHFEEKDQHPRETQAEEDTKNNEDDDGVNMHWLLRHCCWELHSYLRATGFYLGPTVYSEPETVHPVGSRKWEPVVMEKFEETLVSVQTRRLSHQQQLLSECTTIGSSVMIQIQDGKAFLRPGITDEYGQYRCLRPSRSSSSITTSITASVDDDSQCNDPTKNDDNPTDQQSPSEGGRQKQQQQHYQEGELQLIRQIDLALTDIVVKKDGGHQVSLQLVLHRYPDFKRLLCGRDLWKLYQLYSRKVTTQDQEDSIGERSDHYAPSGTDNDQSIAQSNCATEMSFFNDIIMFQNGPSIILQSKRPKTLSRTSVGGTVHIGSDDNTGMKARLKVDEEGLYSVTNTKWGRALANLMVYGCRKVNLFGDCDLLQSDDQQIPEKDRPTRNERLVVDMTASVGGITLGLAKCHFFRRIIAIEIDPIRAGLCQENMLRHGFDQSVVTVRNTDSVAEIPSLPRGACFVLDPPWGGYDYKHKARQQQGNNDDAGRDSNDTHYRFRLGDTLLEDVLLKIAHHNAPCIVGLRLPINYEVPNLLGALREKLGGNEVECITVRKVSVQLFVILYFSWSLGEKDDAPHSSSSTFKG